MMILLRLSVVGILHRSNQIPHHQLPSLLGVANQMAMLMRPHAAVNTRQPCR